MLLKHRTVSTMENEYKQKNKFEILIIHVC